jgi:hypothetical protein
MRLPVVKEFVPNALLVLIGNKKEETAIVQVPREEAELYASRKGMLFFETSAKTGYNVEHVTYLCLLLCICLS